MLAHCIGGDGFLHDEGATRTIEGEEMSAAQMKLESATITIEFVEEHHG